MANPEDTTDHEHVMVPRMREADRMAWEQCTKCSHRTDETPAPEITDADRLQMRADHARRLADGLEG